MRNYFRQLALHEKLRFGLLSLIRRISNVFNLKHRMK